MNILLITHIFPPAIDGGSKVISKIGEYLKKDGHIISIITTNYHSTDDFVSPTSKPLESSEDKKLNIYRLPVYKIFRRSLKLINLFFPKNTYVSDLNKVFQKGPIFKLIPFIKTIFFLRKQKFDLIIAGPLPTTIIIYAYFLKKILKTKLLINASFHQTDQDFLRIPLTKTLQKTDYIWSLTQYEKDYFVKNLKVASKKIILVGNGIDSNILISPDKIKFPKNPNLLFIGSLASHKRVELLIDAFSRLSPQFPSLSLTIAGQKTLYYPQVKLFLDKLPKNIKEKIHFKFNFSQSELSKLIDSSTILILPSMQESFGLVLIESWSRGKPVIVSNIPPLQELVKKTIGGLSFSIDSSLDLQNKIKTLINDLNLCQTLGKNGLEYVKHNYTWDCVTKKICKNIF